MCGLAGFVLSKRTVSAAGLAETVTCMADALTHRGPDSSGVWVAPEAGVALGHRRLAIVDLSHEGRQPMVSPSQRFVISFNGEIYNFRDVRSELEGLGHGFRGHSDTEVLLTAIDRWGLERTLPRLVGMFAFALWDRESRSLQLVSDRVGKKPLYFGRVGSAFVFASELKAFHVFPGFEGEVERGALSLLLRQGCLPSPYSIYRDIFKLPPGSVLTLPFATGQVPAAGELVAGLRRYWSQADFIQRPDRVPFTLSTTEVVDQLEQLLTRAVGQRMIADVPLGALLSGGIDSSLVVALMQRQSSRPVRTFSIGFTEAGFDEATDAKRVAGHLGTDHTELYVTPEQARAVISRLPDIYDEPFADRSQIPTFLVAQLARQDVTVALSGDGGDEVFGGYNRHFYAPWLWRRMKPWPRGVRRLVAEALIAVPPRAWDRVAERLYRMLPRSSRQPTPGYRIHKLADLLAVDRAEDLYRKLTSYWDSPARLVIGGWEPPTILTAAHAIPQGTDLVRAMMYYDAVTYLPDDILVKVDRASMAVSLEVRAPLLDHRLIEFAWGLPDSLKVRQRQGKWILRQVLDRYVPRYLVDRPKQGFDLPVDAWLRGPLRDWAESMLDPGRLTREGFLRPEPIRAVWAEHLSGTRDRAWALWPVLMFQIWRERWGAPQNLASSRPSRLVAPAAGAHADDIGPQAACG